VTFTNQDDPGKSPAGDTPAPSKAPEDRSTEFVAVQGGNDGTSAEGLLVTAYLVMWAALLAFIFMTWRKQGSLEERIAKLETLKKSTGKS
jgi:CcmD family protein